jgi:hypothetical protein
MERLLARCEDLEDPRTGDAGRHDLAEIMVIALCTVPCGGRSMRQLPPHPGSCEHVFARQNRDIELVLRNIEPYDNGVQFPASSHKRARQMSVSAAHATVRV